MRMNQILENFSKLKNSRKSRIIYRIIFFTLLICICTASIFFLLKIYEANQNQILSQKLTESYSISTLYSNSISYTAESVDALESQDPFVIRYYKN